MTLSIYDTAMNTFRQVLGAMDKMLSKAERYADEKKFAADSLLRARLFPDMFDLIRQVQIACDMAKSGGARLAGVEVPKHEDNETTFAELHARIAKVLDFLKTLNRAALDAAADRAIVLEIQGRKMEFTGRDYLVSWVLPNFYFHATTAYNLLRHNGLAIGKVDFLARD